MTTLAVRAREQAIERRFTALAAGGGRDVGVQARALAGDQIAERIGGRLSAEQAHALEVITGPERAAILVGPAGTGKGVVIDAAARAEQHVGHRTLGIAVSGSTAQRLGQDSPALAGHTLTLDALVSRVERGQLAVDAAHDDLLRRGGHGRHRPPRAGSPKSWSTPGQSSWRSVTPRSCPRSAPAACSPGSPTSPRAPSSRTSAAPWTATNSARGRTCAPAAQTARWRTTTRAGNCTWQTPATRPSSRPRRTGRRSPRPTTRARSR